jgi:hypothetical protein
MDECPLLGCEWIEAFLCANPILLGFKRNWDFVFASGKGKWRREGQQLRGVKEKDKFFEGVALALADDGNWPWP